MQSPGKSSPFGRAGDESLQTRAENEGKDAVMCSFHGWLPLSLSFCLGSRSLSLCSALLGGWVTRRKCLGSANVGLKTRCVAWRWWGRDATETKYKPAYRDTSEDRGQQWRLTGPTWHSKTVPVCSRKQDALRCSNPHLQLGRPKQTSVMIVYW